MEVKSLSRICPWCGKVINYTIENLYQKHNGDSDTIITNYDCDCIYSSVLPQLKRQCSSCVSGYNNTKDKHTLLCENDYKLTDVKKQVSELGVTNVKITSVLVKPTDVCVYYTFNSDLLS